MTERITGERLHEFTLAEAKTIQLFLANEHSQVSVPLTREIPVGGQVWIRISGQFESEERE